MNPGTLRGGTLVYRETVGAVLHETHISPQRAGQQGLPLTVLQVFECGQAASLEILGVVVEEHPSGRRTVSRGEPHRLTPESGPVPAVTRKAYVTVVCFVAERHLEADSQPLDEILLSVAVEDERMCQADGGHILVHHAEELERQPFAASAQRLVPALDSDRGLDGVVLHQRHRLHLATEVLIRRGILSALLQDHHEGGFRHHCSAVSLHIPDEAAPVGREEAAHSSGVDEYPFGSLHRKPSVGLHGGAGASPARRRTYAQREIVHPHFGYCSESEPLQRAVRPIGKRPGGDRDGVPAGLQLEHGVGPDRALGERHSPGTALPDSGPAAFETGETDILRISAT